MQLSGLDGLLERLFAFLTGLPHEVASTIYLRDEGTARRRELVDAIAKIKINGELLSRWEAIRAEHQALFQLRNRLMHDTWAINATEGTFALLRPYPPGKRFTIDLDFFPSVSDDALERVAVRAGALSKQILELLVEIDARRRD